ncbi:MAG: DNA/RNA nuclease SfsA [Oscillospiraceae bacterium]|nr:DNA/RNA nuclease SfsA [Oscillospiraceae bacterium]
MKYTQPIVKGNFIERPNRFIAKVLVNGTVETVHVKNTGRCRELLIPNATVYLEHWDTDTRKTKYDLIAVEKGERLINMDSQAPNKVAGEYLPKLFPDLTLLKAEVKHGNSRFDFYMERPITSVGADSIRPQTEKWFIEVKGVTLEEDGIVRFPDAPTERGVKHIEELISCLDEGYRAMILFIVKMKGVTRLEPNDRTHPQFGEALRRAAAAGVEIRAVDCIVTPDGVVADMPLMVKL